MAKQISKIVDGLRYNTVTATKICSLENDEDRGDFRFEITALYQTPRGRFFLAGHGGAMSRWARSVRDGRTGGEGLTVVSAQDARAFAEEHADEDTVAKYFEIEEA
ncbi:hypothetical protein [Agrobacterium sp. NPDC089420]|uniref:hypothetical protein n=1 Tax=Agrobacterium sp. NPDC089420 TaxID=3363918 RepID=UPI00384B98CC